MRKKSAIEQHIENIQLNELAYSRADALERCYDLGQKFIEHFKETFAKGLADVDFQHHCQEMQAWYDSVAFIVLKNTKKLITTENLVDWFFTRGSLPKYLFDTSEEASAYKKLIKKLTDNRKIKVIDAMKDIMSGESKQ